MKAAILVSTDSDKLSAVAAEVKKIQGVKEAFPVAGRADVVAIVDSKDLKELAGVSLKIFGIGGVSACETLVEVPM
ncbi:MAG: Lrp/AsnC ligand binding domain-containing protein [Candidatus Brockarchaeota archaeon]|nr:Lrp/AsnC ligand binding domain-containing protein [Candidatus Brockarchaeota archaeon]